MAATTAGNNPARTRQLTHIGLSLALITVCTWITIPFTIPFTLQTFAIFTIFGLLGGKKGTLTILCYLLIGCAGLPVFSGARGGPAALLGNTGGYLVGFLVMGLCYWLLTKLFGTGLPVRVIALVVGLLLLYLFGSLWFLIAYSSTTGSMGFWGVLSICVFPFVLPDLLKLALSLVLVRRLSPILALEK